ncbi:sugar transferase [Agromyces bauzanensis]|uniref:Polyprenyl glycosylphosphotransferase n=1 Tax=Agromyces bauzanensis TaxID=1308924 RepID=A0A917PTD6_9MICO|nr:sugar transferase [Agromyces bauzanensis]GGJ90178.1 polyprenyl glycosylphosphotransferase [Agromyces bauzanensis]
MTLTRQSSIDSPSAVVAAWQHAYAWRLLVTDLVVVVVAVYGSQLLRFGFDDRAVRIPSDDDPTVVVSYSVVSAILVLGWFAALSFFGTRDRTIVGTGTAEYRRIADATIRMFVVVAVLAFALQSEVGRGYLLIALPLGLSLLLLARWGWRKWLLHRRATGAYSHRAILMGERQKSVHVAKQMSRDGSMGIVLVGAITEHGTSDAELAPGIPVLGDYGSLSQALEQARADTVIFTGADTIDPRGMREIGWQLETTSTNLIVAPALTDVAGPRIHARPVAGLPLIQVDFPEFEGRKYAAKRAFDLVAGSIALVVLSPVFLVLALMVRRDSPGPAFFTQERVGINGKRFHMLKFRSMVVDAEAQLPTLLDSSDGNGVLFKLKADPRVTRVGAFLRRWSLDELPQLVNVLLGEMSLVGPRPPLASEVERYDEWMNRRLLVRPGITGLWQTQGRSDLSWEDSVRLDLYYVENWSLTGDVILLFRTVRSVVRAHGAY